MGAGSLRRRGPGGLGGPKSGRAPSPEPSCSSGSGSESDEPPTLRDAAAAAGAGMPARRRSAAGAAARAAAMPRLKSFGDLPDYLRDNEFIVGSYRPTQSMAGSLRSLWGLHNETGNVWTHLLGFLLFAALARWFAAHPPAPLALTADHVERLWGDVQGRFAHVRADLTTFEGAVGHAVAEGVGRLSGALSARAHALGGGIRGGVAGGLHGLHLDAVAAGLSGGLHDLSEGLHTRAAGLKHSAEGLQHAVAGGVHAASAALNAQLQQQLSAVVQWPMPRWPVYVYFAGACTCLLTSCVCHLLGCCARHISQVVWRFDYAGIAVLIVASFYPAVYYSFLCQPGWRNFYLVTTTAAGLSVIAVSLPNHFQATHYRTLRACVFSALGLWGVVPVAHQLVFFWHVTAVRTAFTWDMLMGALYLGGAFIYASRIPERWYPGRLDLLGHSHQLWHVAVVAAALVHYKAVAILLQWRDASGGCAADLHAHVPTVLAGLQAGGGARALGIDDVWRGLSARLHHFAGVAHPGAALPPSFA